jgi:hypothetical protein
MREYLGSAGTRACAAVAGLLDHDTDTSLVGNNGMGVRRAALIAPGPVTRTSRLTAGPDFLPYLCWWEGQAVGYARDAVGNWQVRRPLTEFLAERALDRETLEGLWAVAYESAGRRAGPRARVREPLPREAWLTGVAFGVLAAEGHPGPGGADALLAHRLVAAGLDTVAPGGLRRMVEPARLPGLSRHLSPLVAAGFRAGFRAATRHGGVPVAG